MIYIFKLHIDENKNKQGEINCGNWFGKCKNSLENP